MWTFLNPFNLIRYLVVLRVNAPQVRLPRWLAGELSWALGGAIARRLPSSQAQAWSKATLPWEAYNQADAQKRRMLPFPEAAWPVESVLLAYPGKLTYGEGESILFEIKLFKDAADHNFFLEVILPTLEEVGYAAAGTPWRSATSLWGHYDVSAVYVARGALWEPLVSQGRLDLGYRATPAQWAEGLSFESPEALYGVRRLQWITPYEMDKFPGHWGSLNPVLAYPRRRSPARAVPPDLRAILEALIWRAGQLLPGKFNTPEDAWKTLNPDEQFSLTDALDQAAHAKLWRSNLQPAPKGTPGRWVGSLDYQDIPLAVIPYLQLASIFHIGRYTHFGCGTFRLD